MKANMRTIGKWDWTIVYTTDHRVHCIFEKYDSFCKRLNELAHD